MAAKQLKLLQSTQTGSDGKPRLALPSLMDWVPSVTPKYLPPKHLAPIVDALSRWREKPFRILFSVPPRHGKTETLLHFFGWALRQDPTQMHAYITYALDLAATKSRKARQYAERGGLELHGSVREWHTPEGGGVFATSINGPLTGKGIDGVAIIDDAVKDRSSAESALFQEHSREWFSDVLYTRLEPQASCIVVMARWTTNDLYGWLSSEFPDRWTVVNMPALSEDAEERPLWPERWTREGLLEKKRQVNEYTWASLYQGRPRPRGANVFDEPRVWTELPTVFRAARGLDLAYTEKTSSDWSVLVTSLVAQNERRENVYYVVDVVRRQKRASDFQLDLKKATKHWERCPIWIYGANGPEAGAVDLLRKGRSGIHQLVHIPAVGDKFLRAQNYAAAWNDGRVLVPADSKRFPWVDEFVSEHVTFTGIGDANDDQVDAGAAMHDSADSAIADTDIPRKPRTLKKPGLAGMAL